MDVGLKVLMRVFLRRRSRPDMMKYRKSNPIDPATAEATMAVICVFVRPEEPLDVSEGVGVDEVEEIDEDEDEEVSESEEEMVDVIVMAESEDVNVVLELVVLPVRDDALTVEAVVGRGELDEGVA